MTGERAKRDPADAAALGVAQEGTVLRRTAAGWAVGDEDLPDLTCAMVLADLIAAEMSDDDPEPGTIGAGTTPAGAEAGGGPAADEAASAGPGNADNGHDEARRLRITVSQLERALAVRIRVEQAIGVLAERHRIRPRQAFERLRAVARGRGQRVIDIAGDVIASATNPLLQLPEDLSRPSLAPRHRSSRRRARDIQ
jgi:hypothetical protein